MWAKPLFILAALALAQPAAACRFYKGLTEVDPANDAVIIVTGRISDYRIISDRQWRQRMLANPNLSDEDRQRYLDPKARLLPDYARFQLTVDRRLKGQIAERVWVSWNSSTYAEPEQLGPGPFLFALTAPRGTVGPDDIILGGEVAERPEDYAPIQAPCASAVILPLDSEAAKSLMAKFEP